MEQDEEENGGTHWIVTGGEMLEVEQHPSKSETEIPF